MSAYASINRVRTTTVSLYCSTCHRRLDLTHPQRIGLPSCSEACAAPLRESWRHLDLVACIRGLRSREAAMDALLAERR